MCKLAIKYFLLPLILYESCQAIYDVILFLNIFSKLFFN